MEIKKELAYKMAQAYVKDYNEQYERLAYSCRVIWLRTLKEELNEIGFGFLLATAKGTQSERKEAFK